MQKTQPLTDPELLGADAALRRAAANAKKLAEQQGTPYVTRETMGRGNQLPTPSKLPRGG